MTRTLLLPTVLRLFLLGTVPLLAAPGDPPLTSLHMTATKPLTPVRDILASLSRQCGVPILADDTVVDTVGVTHIDKPTLPDMLNTITALVPALTWQRIQIPSDAPLPDANALSAQVRDLHALVPRRLVITDAAGRTTLSFSRTATDVSRISDTPDRTIYLVTNETVRAQRLAGKKKTARPRRKPSASFSRRQTNSIK